MKRGRKQLHTVLRTALILTLICALILGCTCLGWAVDLSRGCTVTVSLGTGELAEALLDADLVVDLYLVAGVMARHGEDAFDFQFFAPFDTLVLPETDDPAEWNALSAAAAELARAEALPSVTNARVETVIGEYDGLTPGMYLLLIHGRDEAEIGENGEGVAYAGEYRYLFAPQLVTLPTKDGAEGETVGTDTPGEWIYDVIVYLKPERELAYGSLEIVKALTGYDPDDPALFLFSVEAELHGTPVYSDVIAMDFSAAGEQSVVVDGLPIGATVTVTECYSGAGYQLVSAKSREVVIGDQTVSVRFVNEHVGSPNGLRGIDNYFRYLQDEGWVCEQTVAPSD